MKTKLIIFIASVFLVLACTKNEPQETSAAFTTSLSNNTLTAGESFRVYFNDVSGEFLTYFIGTNPGNSFRISNPPPVGQNINADTDSLDLSPYSNAGQYTFVLVARSYGDFGNEVVMDVDSVQITVVEP